MKIETRKRENQGEEKKNSQRIEDERTKEQEEQKQQKKTKQKENIEKERRTIATSERHHEPPQFSFLLSFSSFSSSSSLHPLFCCMRTMESMFKNKIQNILSKVLLILLHGSGLVQTIPKNHFKFFF